MPSDFSAFALFVAGLASVNAYTEPTTGPSGNPIAQPSLNEIVPVGEPYSITWEPTCEGTVTILLLKGPTENVIPQFPIVELTPNDGEYTWTPGTDLEAGETGYGLQLICDATGEFQYSTQFGIANDGTAPEEPSPEPMGSDDDYDDDDYVDGHEPYYPDSHDMYSYEIVDTLTTYVPEPTDVVVNNITYHCPEPTTLTITDCPCTVTHVPEGPFPVHPSASKTAYPPVYPPYPIGSSGGMPPMSDIIYPTGTMGVPTTLGEPTIVTGDSSEPTVVVDDVDDDVDDVDVTDDSEPAQATAGASELAVGGSAALGLVVAFAGLVGLF